MSPEPDPVVLRAALGRLKTRERFRSELEGWLMDQGFEEEAIRSVLDHCEQKALLSDDRALASHAERAKRRGRSTEQFVAELEALGCGSQTLVSARGLMQPVDLEQACRLLRKRGRADEPSERAARYLCSRGFDEDTARAAVEAVRGSEPGS